ncbi:MAG: cbb3-type cytochrome c oxidase subunit I [Gammaproteobacteria bacterium]
MTDATPSLGSRQRGTVVAYVGVTALVLVLLMVFGLLLRLSQAGAVALPADRFYQVMTAHGIGMVAIAGLGGAAIMWYFLSQYVKLSTGILLANLVLFLLGVVCVLASIFLGGFASAWTFLFPLPAQSAGVWSAGAAALYLIGVLVVGVGFLLFYLDTGRALLEQYGSLGRALGWPQLFGNRGDAPPPTVVVSAVITVINVLSLVIGATVLTICLINVYWPGFRIDALLAKNLIFFFGHVFINSTIYMVVIAVYEILPRYTHRPWRSTKPFLAAWSATLLMVLAVYPHHLLMDFAMPIWAVILGQVLSYTSSLPVFAVTAVGALANVHRSGLRWDLASGLLFLSILGWSMGVIPAVVDGTIAINRVMHNTLWVPGHFHVYLLLGVAAMLFGFMYFLAKQPGNSADNGLDRLAFWGYAVGGFAFTGVFLLSGVLSIPRRYAVHLPEWLLYDRIGSLFAALVVVAALIFALRFLGRLRLIVS